VTNVSTAAGSPITVQFTLTDDRGYPVDIAGVYSLNTSILPRFALAYLTQDSSGNVLPYNVLTQSASQPTAFDPSKSGSGTLVDNGGNAGSYTYTFPSTVAYDATKLSNTHVLWIMASRQEDLQNANDVKTFKAVNQEYDFVPAGGTPAKREIVTTASCSKCHDGFKPDGSVANGIHSGSRNEAPFCNVCHNPGHTSNLDANSARFVHRIHDSKAIQAANQFHGIDITYPQDVRNCDACHGGAAQGGQAYSNPSIMACGSCHDYVSFTGAAAKTCTDPVTLDPTTGLPAACNHAGGANLTLACNVCHTASAIKGYHVPVASPDAGNILVPVTTGTSTAGYGGAAMVQCTTAAPCTCTTANPCYNPNYVFVTSGTAADGYYSSTGVACTAAAPCTCSATAACFSNPFSAVKTGTMTSGWGGGAACSKTNVCTCTASTPCVGAGNNNTNAAYLAAAGAVPAGAVQISYVIKSVGTYTDTSVSPSVLRPTITFKLQKTVNGTTSDVVFNAYSPTGKTELIDGFVGSPSVYWVYSLTQDGITTPSDFNASQSAYIKSVWNGTATTTGTGTMTYDAASGYYTITLTAAQIPAGYKMLTGGVGYTYGLSTTPPLTEIDLSAYPYDPNTRIGGLIVAGHDVWMPAVSTDARRAIVDNARCNNCHAQLGATPTFHAGQRNDGPTCSFCHNANQNNNGWAGNEKDFIHALHAGVQAGTVLPDGTTSPGTGVRTAPFGWHATSTSEGYWDVTFPGPHNNCEACHFPGTYDYSASASAAALPNMLWSTAATGTPVADGYTMAPYVQAGTAYGSGWSVDKAAGTITQAAGTTLVTSPITAACVACHDSAADRGHMKANGGTFYGARGNGFPAEQCLICHGTGAIAPIADVHRQ
jgi:OmcA/MtrC family decaheme c-type cytochrome